MFGKNPKRSIDYKNNGDLDIVEIFYTIQGEGARMGQSAIFIRLGGCNLACKFCDTEFEKFSNHSVAEIIKEIEKHHDKTRLIIITGGEPFRQNITPLTDYLIANNYIVQIETNGTLYKEIDNRVEITCSPKKGSNGYPRIRAELLKNINNFKILISESIEKYSTLPIDDISKWQQVSNADIYLQPIDHMDEAKNRANIKLTTDLALQYGFNVSLQLHKIINLP